MKGRGSLSEEGNSGPEDERIGGEMRMKRFTGVGRVKGRPSS
jgi:hypothetical protein